jgi:mannose-6-phosphate isomerase-like protein (cupin superfamily)
MLVSSSADRTEIAAVDGCRLRELLHPERIPGSPADYSLAIAVVAPGTATHPHTLAQTEVYYVIRGTGRMHIDAESRDVGPGDAIVIPPRATQWIACTSAEPLEFAAIVSPPWRLADDQRV